MIQVVRHVLNLPNFVGGYLSHLLRRLLDRRTILSVGDSHSMRLAGFRNCVVAGLGPVTMQRVGRPAELENLLLQWFRQKRPGWKLLGISTCSPKDVIVLSFGEIDVRCHIGRHVLVGESIQRICETLVNNYLLAAIELKERFNCAVIVTGLVPPSVEHDGSSLPFVGSAEERLTWTRSINLLLDQRAAAHGLGFLDMPRQFEDPNGMLAAEHSDGTVHLSRQSRTLYQNLVSDRLSELLENWV